MLFECKHLKSVPNYQSMSNVELFHSFVDILYKIIMIDKQLWFLDKHFRPQVFECQLWDLITYFDYIVLYDKIHFVNNVEYILMQIELNKQHTQKNGNSVKLQSDHVTIDMKYIDIKYNTGWGEYHNDSLFSQPLHQNSKSYDSEMILLKQYYTKDIALKALTMLAIDYVMLPLPMPWWIDRLEEKLSET